MKERLSVYLDAAVMAQLAAFAAHRNKSLSLIAEAAIASFLSPDGPDKLEAAISRRLDRLSRQNDRLEREPRHLGRNAGAVRAVLAHRDATHAGQFAGSRAGEGTRAVRRVRRIARPPTRQWTQHRP